MDTARWASAVGVDRVHVEAARVVAGRTSPAPAELPAPVAADRLFELREGEQPFAGMRLTFRGRGNEQLVYTADEYPGVAFKVRWENVKFVLEGLGVDALPHWANGTIAEAGRAQLAAHSISTTGRLERMRSMFGAGHSVPRGCGVVEFPFPGRVLRELGFPEVIDPEARYAMTTPVAVQEWRTLEGGLDLATGVQRPGQVSVAGVTRMGQKWVERSLPPGFEPELLTAMAPDSTVPAFIDAVRSRPELAASAREFLDSAREYTRSTGELLALRGRKNLYFDAEGTFHLIDTLGVHARLNSITKVEDKLRQIRDTGQRPPGIATLGPTVTTIASMNALADEVGTEPYWELPEQLKPYPWDTYFGCIDWQSDGQRHEPQPVEKQQVVDETLRARPGAPGRSEGLTK
ncbi:hypothetical protein [Kribbella solani]|uniref:Uncharacterized protein n=1 Tax=Kribbella solani TaxID=236067 RepID=A0A841DEJ4_9ACTN|nr:hypothetical protein [Kribbella solani]MBB5976953.1 hypothetical protein [Kribbella solani]